MTAKLSSRECRHGNKLIYGPCSSCEYERTRKRKCKDECARMREAAEFERERDEARAQLAEALAAAHAATVEFQIAAARAEKAEWDAGMQGAALQRIAAHIQPVMRGDVPIWDEAKRIIEERDAAAAKVLSDETVRTIRHVLRFVVCPNETRAAALAELDRAYLVKGES